MSIDKDLLDRPMEGSSSPGASFGKEGVPAHLTKALAEPALRVEPTEHLDEERAEALPTWRNGSSPKTVATDSGKMLPGIPATAMAASIRSRSPRIGGACPRSIPGSSACTRAA